MSTGMDCEDKKIIKDMTIGSVPKLLLGFAMPLFFSGLLQTVYNMADMIIVGNVLGSPGLSAVSLGGEVLTFLTFISTGTCNAGQVIISQYVGAKKEESIHKIIGTLFTFFFSCAVMMTILCLVLRENILRWINTPPEALQYAREYMIPCMFGLVFIYGYNLVSAILRGMGDSKHPFVFISIASVVNIILDLIFVVGFRWGTFGAAFATVIGQTTSFLFAIHYLFRNKQQFKFDFKYKSFRIYPDILKVLLKLGIPMALQSAAVTFSKLFITSWINSYGVTASALTGVGNKIQAMTNVFAQALSTAGATIIAQNIAAEKYERVKKVIHTSYLFDGVIAIILSVITILYPQYVFGLFTKDHDVLELSLIYIPVVVLLYFSCVFRPPMNALINGSGNSKLNLTIALLDGIVVRIGLALFLGETIHMGIQGFWYGNAVACFMPFIIGMPYYLSGKWKKRRII